MSTSVIALLHGPDQPGLVAKIAGWIHQHGGNVLHADQHLDREENVFFQRVEWQPALDRELGDQMSSFRSLVVEELGMNLRLDRCLLYTSPSPRDKRQSRMPSSA